MTRSGVQVSDSAARPVLSRLSGAQPRRVARHEALIGLAAANSRVLFSSRGSSQLFFFYLSVLFRFLGDFRAGAAATCPVWLLACIL